MSTTSPREESEMTTNIDRAAATIRESFNTMSPSITLGGAETVIAQALADAGLLMPDLPEPSRDMVSPAGKVWYSNGPLSDIRATRDGIVAFGSWRETPFRVQLTTDQAEEIAAILWAAARYRAEQEQGNDGEKKYTVRYYNPIMGAYETHWDTQEEAEKEAAYDHDMNGAPTRVLDPDGNEIATFEEGQRHD